MKKHLLGILCASSLLSSAAMAQDAYFGADFSFISAEITADTLFGSATADADPTALRLRGGVEMNENIALEAVLGVGLQDDEIGDTEFEAGLDTLVGLNAVGIIPLDRTFSLFGKIGFAMVEYEDEEGDTVDDTGVSFGIGAKVNFSRTAGMVLEYTVLPDVEEDAFEVESDMISLGAQFNF